MSIVTIPTWYYQQFDADYTLDIPGEGYGGWKKTELALNTDKTAFVIMHAWDCGTYEQYPGWYRAVEYIPRANHIAKTVFPKVFQKIRDNGLKMYHIAGAEGYAKRYDGYQYALDCLIKHRPTPVEKRMPNAEPDEVSKQLNKFRFENVFYGNHNKKDIHKGQEHIDFMPQAVPQQKEPVVIDGDQLQAVCLEQGVNHLIYMGFAINWCLQYSPASMNDMSNRGFLCSALKDAVTAVENKESARSQSHKEYGLWVTALKNGFVYEWDDIKTMM